MSSKNGRGRGVCNCVRRPSFAHDANSDKAKGSVMNIGKLHVVLVHFPTALAIAACLADLLWVAMRKDVFRHAVFYCLVLAALSAGPAVITGLAAARSQQFVGDYVSIVVVHKWWGIAALAFSVLAAALRVIRWKRLDRWWLAAYCILMVAVVTSIALTGHYGGMLVHGKQFLSGLF